jgi:3',5'-nucleoside bisphosphate phosphatase
MIDLHVHTNCSDGTYAPAEVVALAAARRLTAIAVTDHDTVSGVKNAAAAGKIHKVEIVPGIEISADTDRGAMHILGYFVDPGDPVLLGALEELQKNRRERVTRILKKLLDEDIVVSEREVLREAQGGVPGRPHVARAMFYGGYVRNLQDAFDKFLRKGAPAYVEKTKLSPDKAIELIIQAGGVAVLAHPYTLEETGKEAYFDRILQLKNLGLQGIETHYPNHSSILSQTFAEIASELDLVITGGTDFHGDNKPAIKLGLVNGRSLPYSILESLKARHGSNHRK